MAGIPAARMREIWEAATGLQAVDGLVPSDGLRELAERNVAGGIGFREIRDILRTRDAGVEDFASLGIAEILADPWFKFSWGTLMGWHRDIFGGFVPFAGIARQWPISKPEPVLGGKSVTYCPPSEILPALEHDFEIEERTRDTSAPRLAKFLSNIWQIHPFPEGNTRMVATFFVKYLWSLGLNPDLTVFRDHSAHFRDALVLANGPKRDFRFLLTFMEDMLPTSSGRAADFLAVSGTSA